MDAPPLESLDALAQSSALTAPTERKRMLVVVNPYATTVSDRLRELVVSALQDRYEVDAVDTEAPGHATTLCREAAGDGYDVVVAFGGDGTVNEAANGLAGSPTPLSCLPGGSTNVFHRMLGIPNDVVDATSHLLRMADEWRPRAVDLPSVNGRSFLFASGMGLDASVVRRVDAHPELKARFGPWYFAWAGVRDFVRHYTVHPPRLAAIADGRSLGAGVTVLVQNAAPYTYFSALPVHAAEGGSLDDGALGGIVLRSARLTVMPTIIWRLMSRRARLVDHRQVEGFRGVREIVVTSTDGRPVPLQVDGDHIGDVTEARYAIAPAALLIVA